MTSLRDACEDGDFETFKYLVESCVDVEVDCEYINIAAEYGYINIVKYLVERGTNIHACNNYPIRYSAMNGHFEVFKYLAECGADVHTYHEFPLCLATDYGHLEIVKYLVTVWGVDINVGCDYPIRVASETGHLELVKYLVENGATTKYLTDEDRTYLSFCEKMKNKTRDRAQKKIYFWWIQICYDMEHHSGCGKRMAQKNLDVYESMMKV